MIEIYYTGASENGGLQSIQVKSTGGFISGSLVDFSQVNSVFDSLSHYRLNNLSQKEYVCLAVKFTSDISGVSFYCEKEEGVLADLEFGFVAPTISELLPIFQKIPNIYTAPQVIFTEYTQLNPCVIGDVVTGQILGLWVKRSVKAVPNQDPATLIKQGIFNFKFNY